MKDTADHGFRENFHSLQGLGIKIKDTVSMEKSMRFGEWVTSLASTAAQFNFLRLEQFTEIKMPLRVGWGVGVAKGFPVSGGGEKERGMGKKGLRDSDRNLTGRRISKVLFLRERRRNSDIFLQYGRREYKKLGYTYGRRTYNTSLFLFEGYV